MLVFFLRVLVTSLKFGQNPLHSSCTCDLGVVAAVATVGLLHHASTINSTVSIVFSNDTVSFKTTQEIQN
jgi:hypothetical protein